MKQEYSEDVKKDLPVSSEALPQEWKTSALAGDVPSGWIKTFQDPILEKIVEESLKNNLDLKDVQAKLESSAASARLAGAAANPFVDASGALQTIGTLNGQQINNRSAGLNVSWELDLWGRLKSERDSAGYKYAADSLDYEFARQSLAAATAKVWFLCIEMLQQTTLAQKNLAMSEKNLKITEARVKYGKSSRQNSSLAKADVAARREKLQTSVNSLQQSKRAL
jgi:multidrug efflux system outer membrane protein